MSDPMPRASIFWRLAGGLVVVATVLVSLAACAGQGQESPTPATQVVGLMSQGRDSRAPTTRMAGAARNGQESPTPAAHVSGSESGRITAADGYIPDGEMLTPFDTDLPAVGNLDPDLLNALQRAWNDAAQDGVELFINSGWRSKRYQQELLNEAVVTYGSLAEARKWVNSPEDSTHVTGEAVDIAPADADSWLSQHGSRYGLCQTYANEVWHFELATEPGGTCPPMIPDALAGGSRR